MSLFISQSVPYPPAFFPCFIVAAAPSAISQGRDQLSPTSFCPHHVLGWCDCPPPLLPCSKGFLSSASLFVSAKIPQSRVAWTPLYHCCYCLFISETGQGTCQHLKCPLEGGHSWMREGRCWWLPQPFVRALGSCSCDCGLVKRGSTCLQQIFLLFLDFYHGRVILVEDVFPKTG